MECMSIFLLHVLLQVFCLIPNPVSSSSADVIWIDDLNPECRRIIIYKQNFSIDSATSTLGSTLCLSDTFSAAKYVASLEGKTVYKLTFPCQRDNSYSPKSECNYNNSCSFDCSKLITEVQQKRVFIQNTFRPTRDTRHLILHDILKRGNSVDAMVESIKVILSREKWNSYIMVASNQIEISTVASNFGNTTYLQLFTVNQDLNNSLQRIYSRHREDDLNFIVIASWGSILKILHRVYALESKMSKTSRLLVVPVGGDIGNFLQWDTDIKTSDVVVLDVLRCQKNYTFLDVYSTEQQLSKVTNISETMHLSYMTKGKKEVVMGHNANGLAPANVYTMHEKNGSKTLHKEGCIDESGFVLTGELFPERKHGFNNRTLTVAVLPYPPFINKKEKNGSVSYSGINVDIINELSFRLNFRYILIEPGDGEWGRIHNKKWTGMVKLIMDKKVDMALGPLAIDAARKKVMDFTAPYFFVQSAVILKKPDVNRDKWKTLLAPFRYEVFICILLSLVLSTIFLFIVDEASPSNQWAQNRVTDRLRRLGDILWNHFEGLVAQGSSYLPKSQSGRIVLSFWCLFTITSTAIYSGNLIAFLTDWREKPPFYTLQEMVEQDAIKWGILGGSSYVILFQNSKRPEYKKIWQGLSTSLIEDPDVMSTDIDVHLRKVLEDQYAFISDVSLLGMWQSNHCDLLMLPEEFLLSSCAIGLQKGSPYTDIISNQLSQMYESGLIETWYNMRMPQTHCKKPWSAKRVDLVALQSAFYTAAVGVILAILVMTAEVLVKRIRRCDENSPTDSCPISL